MTMTARDGIGTLTEKEKQTLRLIVRGHDAKSTARSLNLSVHTINKRLRDARKMAVSSSREAARILFEAESERSAPPTPELSGDRKIGEDARPAPIDQDNAPGSGVGPAHRRPVLIVGVLSMTLALLDPSRWAESYRLTDTAFRMLIRSRPGRRRRTARAYRSARWFRAASTASNICPRPPLIMRW